MRAMRALAALTALTHPVECLLCTRCPKLHTAGKGMATVTDAAAVPVAGAVTLVKDDVVQIDKPKKRFALSRKKQVETQAEKQVLAVSLSKLFSLADTTDKASAVYAVLTVVLSSRPAVWAAL
jgi:hypothetical protein